MSKRERIKYIFPAALILFGAAIQNSYFDELFNVGGMDAVSLLLSVILIIETGRSFVRNKWKLKKHETILLMYFIFIFLYGFVSSGINGRTLLMFRTSLYFLSAYMVFSTLRLEEAAIVRLYRISGLLNSLICLYFYFQNVGLVGIHFRNVSINLYFSVLAVIMCLFADIPGENKIIKYGISVLCALAVVTSQQRTQIIPLAIAIGLFIFANLGFSLKGVLRIVVVFALVYGVYQYTMSIGVFELVLNRFRNGAIIANDSTLWARTTAASNAFKDFSIFQWLVGTGITGNVELEMFFPNYIYKYGIVGSLLIISCSFSPAIKYSSNHLNSIHRALLVSFLILFVGGFISGLGGQNGQLMIASMFSLAASRNIVLEEKEAIVYRLPFVSKTLLRRSGGGTRR